MPVAIIDNFRFLINDLLEKGKNSRRRIIYCQTVKQCSHLFRMFELDLGSLLYVGEIKSSNRLVEMMHSGSPPSVKTHVLDQFGDNTKNVRILIATVAFSLTCQLTLV